MAETCTPSTSTRGMERADGPIEPVTSAAIEFSGNPVVGRRQALLEADPRLPSEDLAKLPVVGVATADPLRTLDVHQLDVFLPGHLDGNLCELVDGDQLLGAEIERDPGSPSP